MQSLSQTQNLVSILMEMMRTNIVYFRNSVTEKSSAKKELVHPVCTIGQVNPQIYQYSYARLDHASKPSQEKIDLWLKPLMLLALFQCQFDNLENLQSVYPITPTEPLKQVQTRVKITCCKSRIPLLSSRGEHFRIKKERLGFTNSFLLYTSTLVTTFSVASLTYLLVRREGSPVTFSSGHEYSMEGQLDFKYAMAFKSHFIFQALSQEESGRWIIRQAAPILP